jgi:hypothetical protein
MDLIGCPGVAISTFLGSLAFVHTVAGCLGAAACCRVAHLRELESRLNMTMLPFEVAIADHILRRKLRQWMARILAQRRPDLN